MLGCSESRRSSLVQCLIRERAKAGKRRRIMRVVTPTEARSSDGQEGS